MLEPSCQKNQSGLNSQEANSHAGFGFFGHFTVEMVVFAVAAAQDKQQRQYTSSKAT